MRIEWHDTQDIDNIGQFVVYAENEIERGLLRRFVNKTRRKGWRFLVHGSCYSHDSHDFCGVTSFNFGCVEDKEHK